MPISVQAVVSAALQFYSLLIIVYVLMSWFPVSGFFEDIYRVLGVARRAVPRHLPAHRPDHGR